MIRCDFLRIGREKNMKLEGYNLCVVCCLKDYVFSFTCEDDDRCAMAEKN